MAAWQNDWRLGREFPRFLADLMAAEFARMRPGAPPLRLHDDADLGTDSLEQLRLAMAVSTTLRLGPERLQEMRRFPDWIAECRRVVESPDPGLAFKTSGSSGEPRFVSQPFAALAQEADALAAVLGGATRVVAVVPSHHIYGFLFTILLPQKLGLPVLDARVHAPNTLTALLREGDVVVAFPTFWQAAAELGVCWPGGVVGTTSGAPCPRHIGPALRAQNLSRLVEIYGSTETGGVGWRDDAEKPFRLAPIGGATATTGSPGISIAVSRPMNCPTWCPGVTPKPSFPFGGATARSRSAASTSIRISSAASCRRIHASPMRPCA